MANYIKTTDYSVKDTLISGDPDKIVKGTEIDEEFDAIAVAIQTKADLVSPTFLGTPTAPTASQSVNNTQIATTAFAKAAATASLQAVYPVGSVYINATNATNPATLLGFGTWVAFGAGRVMVGFNASDPLFDSAEETGGSKDAIAVSHTHTFSGTTANKSLTGKITVGGPNQSPSGIVTYELDTGARPGLDFASGSQHRYNIDASHDHTFSGTTASSGSAGTNANLQPYITVYMWKRTA
jgi:hypothetical protein